jgi:hypothetical protein
MSFIRSGRGKRRLIHRTEGDCPTAFCGAVVGGKHSDRLAGVKLTDPHYCPGCKAEVERIRAAFEQMDSSQKHETAGQCV